MKYMLDTNTCIFIIKQDENVLHHLKNIDFKEICISSITLAELEFGVAKGQHIEKNTKALKSFISNFQVLSFDENAANEYGKIRAYLENNGNKIGAMDMLIAAHAKSENLILVTNNTREFNRVDGLHIQDWKS